jgi:flagellum-specific ATP synthase
MKLSDESDFFSKYKDIISSVDTLSYKGRVEEVRGLIVESLGPDVRMGEICFIEVPGVGDIAAEVVGFSGSKVYLMPYSHIEGIYPGCYVRATGRMLRIAVGDGLIGRVVDGKGDPMDGHGKIKALTEYPLDRDAINPLQRELITEALPVGIRAIDGLLTVGKGQRVGIFAGSGVGKSTLLSMMAKNTTADITVIALVGERGREVKEFIEENLGKEGLKKSIVVSATSDQSPLLRLRCVYTATTIAEFFRDQGKDVLLLVDSITRVARAQREIALSIGEPPATRGYPPSVFAILPRILERAGRTKKGTITAFYTVLVEADDLNEPIADTIRGTIDGHIVLSRELARSGHYPAIDILDSVSRLMNKVISKEHKRFADSFRRYYSLYRASEDVITLGAYTKGTNPELDKAIELYPKMRAFLEQDIDEAPSFEETLKALKEIFEEKEERGFVFTTMQGTTSQQGGGRIFAG